MMNQYFKIMTIIEFTEEWDNWNPGYYDYKKIALCLMTKVIFVMKIKLYIPI